MAVYVDPLFATAPKPTWPYKEASHMTADTVQELHALAKRLHLKRLWFQNHHTNRAYWHYDLTRGKYYQAIRLGAIPLSREASAERLRAASIELRNK